MQRMELIGGEPFYPNMPAENQSSGGLTLSERLTRIENGQVEMLRIIHDIELKGSQTAQAALMAADKLEMRVDHLERHTITADAVNVTLNNTNNETKATRRWLIATVIAVLMLTITVIFNLLTVHKVSFGS